MGRVKVKFPWLSDDDESQWARVITFMASEEYGSFFLPEVGDEVAISFDQGDIDYPYVIGSLYNGENKPPEDNSDGKNNIRTIKSRSGHEIILNDDDDGKIEINSNAGHKICLDDSSGGEKIEITSSAGHNICLDDSSGGEKIEITDKSGSNSILIDSSQNLIGISSEMKITLKSQMIDIEAGGTLNIKSNGTLKIEGTLVQIN